MRESSPRSERAFILKPVKSRRSAAIFALIHGIALVAVVASAIPGSLAAVAALCLIAHAGWRWPRSPPMIVGSRTGPWALPELGRYNLGVSPRTILTRQWISLCLEGRRGYDTVIHIGEDQLEPEDWRRLRVALRERQ